MVLFVFQCYLVFNLGKFISFGLGTVRHERVNLLEGISCLKLNLDCGTCPCLAMIVINYLWSSV